MRLPKRLTALLLSAALLLPALPAAQAEEPTVTGSISGTVRIDYPQNLDTLRARDLRVTLVQDGKDLWDLDLTREDSSAGNRTVSLRNQDGGELGGGNWPGYLDFTFGELAQGRYALRFDGRGYRSFTQNLTLDQFSQHITLGTGDATFTLGDFNGDGRVDSRDRDRLSDALGSKNRGDLEQYDLNSDGSIDIYDLAAVSRNLNASGQAEVRDTTLLTVSEDAIRLDSGVTVLSGNLADLLRNNGNPVMLSAANGPVGFSVVLAEAVEMEQIQIRSLEGPGKILEGTVKVTYADGGSEEVSFDNTLPDNIHAISAVPGSGVITISLGKRVAVKEVTVTVTRTEGGEYAAVESIQFLREIVPENPVQPSSEIRNLTAEAGDGRVSLRWGELPNVSGYRVDYWPKEDSAAVKSLRVNINRADVTGLENLKVYCFTVTPVDGTWEGKTSAAVEAEPQPSKAPNAPDMISVSELDSALRVSWKAVKTATYYELYYKPETAGSYSQWEGRISGTSAALTGLTNGVQYSIYLVAGNAVGVSGKSRIAEGTPQAVDYSRPEGIPTEGVIDWEDIEKVWLANANNVSPSSYTADKPFRAENMADGDFSTHWTSHSYGDGNWWDNKQVLATFKRPVDLSSVIWVPRLDGAYPSNLRVYTVTIWRDGDDLDGPGTLLAPSPAQGGSASDVNTWLSVRNNPAVTKFAVLPFEPVTDVVKIAITIEQVAYTAVSLSELMFMEYDPAHCLPDNIGGLFADSLRLSLRSGVTQSEIDTLRARLNSDEQNYYLNLETLADELDLAEELLSGSSRGVVVEGIDSRSAAADNAKYGQSGSDLQPLGAAAKAKEEITIYASGIPAGQTVAVYATQFNAEASAWRAQVGTLENGRNVLTIPQIGSQNTPRGGSLYITYSGTAPESIRLHVRRAVDIPALDVSDWYRQSETENRNAVAAYMGELEAYVAAQGINSSNRTTNCLNVTEIATPTVLLSMPASAILDGSGRSQAERAETLYQSILAWEDLLHICNTTQGIDNTYARNDMQTRQNIRCMQMFSGAFMYAAGNHVGIGYGSCGGMACGKPIVSLDAAAAANQLFGWGIAHEIGHNMDKLGKAEITNNLYSLMVQTYDGKQNTLTSRLEASGKYNGIFTKVAQGYPGDSNDVFVQLGLYWQLHLAYDGGDSPMDFYNRFFKAWKAGTYFNGASAYADRAALTASAVADRNLTEFFTRWGMVLSDSTKTALANYPAEDRAVWYLNDQSRRARLAGQAEAAGSVSVSAALENEKEVTLTIAANLTQGTLQGYEILRNGVPIGFTAEGSYTDVIGSANHRTYTYSVKAYDVLGNCFASAETEELRIAYDKVVPASEYAIMREGDAVIITLQTETPVSGLKITGAARPSAGEYSVAIASQDGGAVTARTGSFDQGNQAADDQDSYLVYFWKPGTEGKDTRIWTYDAKTVTITGIPESVPDGDIQLLSYAGDDVAFLEAGSVGVLQTDYPYGEGRSIPAGTLIITGTYRGDPVYQTVKIEGRFTQAVLTDGDSGAGDVAETVTTRWLDGTALLFAEIPEDGEVSDISDGIFIFIPNVQREAELQGTESNCSAVSLLPSEMRAVLSRTDLPDAADSQRVTAETLWINTPGGADLPVIVLEDGE
ncbi:MAG: hypothetical protein HFF84_08195 [Oscillibacter sp.]|nr:hypothetical protein [Oscillibacter sp.]